MDTQTLLTIPEAAALLGVTRAAIYEAIKTERLKPVTVLGKQVLQRAEVESYQPRAYRDRPGSKGKGGRPRKSQTQGAA